MEGKNENKISIDELHELILIRVQRRQISRILGRVWLGDNTYEKFSPIFTPKPNIPLKVIFLSLF